MSSNFIKLLTGFTIGAGITIAVGSVFAVGLFVAHDTQGQDIITTIAGSGASMVSAGGYSGDDEAATDAQLFKPAGIALDASGNVYIADEFNDHIRKVNVATGIITTIAGKSEESGYSGDNGPATNAELWMPTGVALDASGNIYIADHNRIRKITSATGIITTIAGTGFTGLRGTGRYSGDGRAATAAEFNETEGIALDASGNIYIADVGNNRIRKVTAATGIITTVAGNGNSGYAGDRGAATAAKLNGPYGVALDASGNIYIADLYNVRVRKVTVATGIITTIAGKHSSGYSGDGGASTAAELSLPTSVAVDASGNIYIADHNRIRKVNAATGIITTIAGCHDYLDMYEGDGGAAASAYLNHAGGVALDNMGNVYISDTENQRIRKVTKATGKSNYITDLFHNLVAKVNKNKVQ